MRSVFLPIEIVQIQSKYTQLIILINVANLKDTYALQVGVKIVQ